MHRFPQPYLHLTPTFSQDDVFEAAERGEYSELKNMIELDAARVLAADEYGQTALHHAAYKGHTAIVKLLLDAGADVNAAEGMDGATALFLAAVRGHTAIVKLLMDTGANVDAQNNYGETALQVAEENGHSEIAALLRALFDALDLDRDGTVTYKEVRKGFRGKRKDELRQLAEACGHQWQSLEGCLYDHCWDQAGMEGFSFQEFGACLSAAAEEDT